MDVLIESTKRFEKNLKKLTQEEKAATVQAINDCASLFPTQKADVYRKLRRSISLRLPSDLDLKGYESSLYILRVSRKRKRLIVILAVDEDPIFGQVIFTLFRVVQPDDLDKAYKSVAESLYQELRHTNRETAQIS
ncbi:hypothetical protein [Limnoraphis robusta]|uniref:Uncharacterized protein n=1 Tax=Limnoraphis robusta CCNP1315 TaxID=3110306 RepID=A0ABU5U7I3_9CYAN|nr:hypothetical protein [Limnoraphis robusta]MEA5523166.1 hypothetical protein [Limnoraphis robusta CCNP1315]MEA5544749.1 hypothetical protein [Limnoraphis robusta CCNP1324]